ncbi:hypothetical protein F5148DRAFT_1291362 [Russula earlei]|uniref:Uncharacterized protein n=1 Tax=Russula earlei TaxID=71964 RepID=A0ACC0TV95_9AGAM|nr:hypothetical protein F5148DRAFT_1291362 [Russula earlei]
MADSLKTHPDCVVRYQNTASQTTVDGKYTPIPASVKKLSNKILLWNMFDDLKLTACLYRILLEKDNGNTDEWYDFMTHNVFFGLLYATNQLSRFNVIGIMQKEYIAKDYYALQTMLEQMSQEDLEKYCKQLANLGFWQNTTADAKGLKLLMATLTTTGPDNTDKQKDIASKNFITSYSTSMAKAQSKVFKEVDDEISSTMKVISQDGALVGYLAFTKLEKASEDSFNYRISIMDENLNDIGKINFKEEKLDLQAVAFEGDVLCLAYLKSNIIGEEFKNRKSYKSATQSAKNSIFTQFLTLDGKIIKTDSKNVEIDIDAYPTGMAKRSAVGALKHGIQLGNIPQKGFACFYGDDKNNSLILYSTAGEVLWDKHINDAKEFLLTTTKDDAYLLSESLIDYDNRFQIEGYSVHENVAYARYTLQDKQGNPLYLTNIDRDPVSGKLCITGKIARGGTKSMIITVKNYTQRPYNGVFTLVFNGHGKAGIQETYSYWSDESKVPDISRKGWIRESDSYSTLSNSFRDYEGNSYFIGSGIRRRTKWGAIAFSVITAPLVIPPIMILGIAGTVKCKITDATVVKQDAKGNLSLTGTIPGDKYSYALGKVLYSWYNERSFYHITNSVTKTDYMVMNDKKNIIVYNIPQKKVLRTIARKEGRTTINVFPAKEGHIMVSEYNRKEKYTKLSIEAL